MGRFCKLVMVTSDNNNKYYQMTENGDKIDIEYGRMNVTAIKDSKPLSQWHSTYNSKIKKGYKDITDFLKETTVEVVEPTTKPEQFLHKMKNYTAQGLSAIYSVNVSNATALQIEESQKIIDQIKNSSDEKYVNELLIRLYTIFPRRLEKVQEYLLPNVQLDKLIEREQATLDAVRNSVKVSSPTQSNLSEVLGITIEEYASRTSEEFGYILSQIKQPIKAIYKVRKEAEEKRFDDWLQTQQNKTTKHLIHGTKCLSVLPIIEQGLKIRPQGNFSFSGKVYGNGNYFSEVVNKSMGYTGHTPDKILFVYEVHTGNPFIYEGWYKGNAFPLTYEELKQRNFDSTYVKAGGGLLNSEIIAYREEQCKIKYIIHL